MKPTIYKFTYRYSEKEYKFYYNEYHSEDDAIKDFLLFRPQVTEYDVEVVIGEPDLGKLLAHSRLKKHWIKKNATILELQKKADSIEKTLAIKGLKKQLTQYQYQMNQITRKLNKKEFF